MKKVSERFVRMYGPILDALREVGGEAPAREIAREVADRVLGGTDERIRELKSGGNAAENEVAWARNNLREGGLIDGSTRGVWRLTAEGWKTHLDIQSALKLGKHSEIIKKRSPEVKLIDENIEAPTEDNLPIGPSLIETIRALPPKGFERLCQRILRESGFTEVTVTGRAGDGGIDGRGILQINDLVTFRVLFQCKRYEGSVGPGAIRDFQGAMLGRTDKGIFLTTGTFTAEAQREAARDGVPPLELVDKDRLISLMENKGIGVKPRMVFDVDDEFFEPFRQET